MLLGIMVACLLVVHHHLKSISDWLELMVLGLVHHEVFPITPLNCGGTDSRVDGVDTKTSVGAPSCTSHIDPPFSGGFNWLNYLKTKRVGPHLIPNIIFPLNFLM